MRQFFIAALLFALAGCGPSEKDLVGTWVGKLQLPEGSNDALASAVGAVNVSLELGKDQTFKTLGFEGTWSYKGDTLTLTPTKTLGLNLSASATVTTAQVAKDAKSFTIVGPFARQGTFVFTKAQ